VPSTTIAPTTVVPTTVAPAFQALLQPTTTTTPAESDFLVLFPDELPNTGSRFNLAFFIAALGLLVVGALIGFLNIRSNGSTRKERNS
jgi:LPXTG-motif cell wall-anchored protein